jgi:hypothetical protein
MKIKHNLEAGPWELMPVILATWESEMGRLQFKATSGQTVPETPISNNGWVLACHPSYERKQK